MAQDMTKMKMECLRKWTLWLKVFTTRKRILNGFRTVENQTKTLTPQRSQIETMIFSDRMKRMMPPLLRRGILENPPQIRSQLRKKKTRIKIELPSKMTSSLISQWWAQGLQTLVQEDQSLSRTLFKSPRPKLGRKGGQVSWANRKRTKMIPTITLMQTWLRGFNWPLSSTSVLSR